MAYNKAEIDSGLEFNQNSKPPQNHSGIIEELNSIANKNIADYEIKVNYVQKDR